MSIFRLNKPFLCQLLSLNDTKKGSYHVFQMVSVDSSNLVGLAQDQFCLLQVNPWKMSSVSIKKCKWIRVRIVSTHHPRDTTALNSKLTYARNFCNLKEARQSQFEIWKNVKICSIWALPGTISLQNAFILHASWLGDQAKLHFYSLNAFLSIRKNITYDNEFTSSCHETPKTPQKIVLNFALSCTVSVDAHVRRQIFHFPIPPSRWNWEELSNSNFELEI